MLLIPQESHMMVTDAEVEIISGEVVGIVEIVEREGVEEIGVIELCIVKMKVVGPEERVVVVVVEEVETTVDEVVVVVVSKTVKVDLEEVEGEEMAMGKVPGQDLPVHEEGLRTEALVGVVVLEGKEEVLVGNVVVLEEKEEEGSVLEMHLLPRDLSPCVSNSILVPNPPQNNHQHLKKMPLLLWMQLLRLLHYHLDLSSIHLGVQSQLKHAI